MRVWQRKEVRKTFPPVQNAATISLLTGVNYRDPYNSLVVIPKENILPHESILVKGLGAPLFPVPVTNVNIQSKN